MQTLILIAVNFIMLALFYLIVSLKLERSASEFREKKLKKQMAEIITEFNSSADRNISLLENRISTLKNLLNHSGKLNSVDVELHDSNINDMPVHENSIDTAGQPLSDESYLISGDMKLKSASTLPDRKKSLIIMTEKFNNTLSKFKLGLKTRLFNNVNVKEQDLNDTDEIKGSDELNMIGSNIDYKISKDATQLGNYLNKLDVGHDEIEADEVSSLSTDSSSDMKSNEDILKMFSDTSDKYSLIADLYDNGHTMEDISLYSGIPIGEIRLVLNLQDS